MIVGGFLVVVGWLELLYLVRSVWMCQSLFQASLWWSSLVFRCQVSGCWPLGSVLRGHRLLGFFGGFGISEVLSGLLF